MHTTAGVIKDTVFASLDGTRSDAKVMQWEAEVNGRFQNGRPWCWGEPAWVRNAAPVTTPHLLRTCHRVRPPVLHPAYTRLQDVCWEHSLQGQRRGGRYRLALTMHHNL